MFPREKTAHILHITFFPILIIFSAFWFLSLDVQWYKNKFLKLHIYEEVDTSMADQSISNIVLYLQGKEPLDKNLFSPQAQYHLFDVKIIFQTIRAALTLVFIINVTILLYSNYAFGWKLIIEYFRDSLSITCIFLVFFGIIVFFFRYAFDALHKLLFTNNLWLFDSSDPLIQMLPDSLFYDLTIRIYLFSSVISFLSLLCVLWLQKTIKINN